MWNLNIEEKTLKGVRYGSMQTFILKLENVSCQREKKNKLWYLMQLETIQLDSWYSLVRLSSWINVFSQIHFAWIKKIKYDEKINVLHTADKCIKQIAI